jgi:hypothetical protein
MRKTLLIAAALVLAGCGPKKAEAPEGGMAADTSMAAPADTGMAGGMAHDSMSGMKSDTTMARDSAK